MAKSHKLPFSSSLSSTTFPLELIHSDVWGPSPITSFHGFRYYVTFIDDFSKFVWVYFLKHKSEVAHIFSCFKAQIENILGTTIKTLRTDGGTEYLPIQRHFPQIIHQTSCPYTPQQNGVAERKHRHLVELSLASMSHASIPTDYWDDIFSSVAFLINRLPSTSHQTPFTTLFKKDPDYASLRILGCLCFPHTRPYNTHKLQLRALPCVFLGYASQQKGYRCLHIPTKKFYISRHVQFVETIFPFSELPLPSPDLTSFSSNLLGFLLPNLPALTRPAPASAPALPLASSSAPAHPSPALSLASSSAPARPAPAIGSSPFLGLPPTISSSDQARPATPSPARPAHVPSPAHPDIPSSPAPSALPFPQLSPPGYSTSSHPMVTRTRDNTRKPRTYPNHVAFNVTIETEPSTFSQAHQHPCWQQAMQTEIDALTSNHTWTLVPPSPAIKVIGCK